MEPVVMHTFSLISYELIDGTDKLYILWIDKTYILILMMKKKMANRASVILFLCYLDNNYY